MKKWMLPLLVGLMLSLTACGENQDALLPAAGDAQSAGGEKEVWQLSIVQPPEKLDYEEGETFDPTGVVIQAQLRDGSVLGDVPYEGVIVDAPLTRTSLYAKFVYGGKTAEQKINVTLIGNRDEYSVANTEELADSALRGKTIYWLGSSVTVGASAGGESMSDFIAKKYGAVCIKEAVSGTTLADVNEESYVERLDAYLASPDRAEQVDAFVCQLSTNDKGFPDRFGTVTGDDVRDASAFDRTTTFGAMEYIIATVRETWDCPIYFYTNPPMGDENYGTMVDALEQIAAKWDVGIIDLYRDEAFNDLTDEERDLYMSDSIHPTKAGYREWWLPKFEEALLEAAG